MLASKYKPFRQQTKQLRTNLNKPITSAKIQQLAIAFPNTSVRFILTTDSNTLFILDQEGNVLLSQQFQGSISNPLVVNQDLALLYDRQTNSLVQIDLKQPKMVSITCEQSQLWQGLSSELFYFKDSKQLCLVEKDPTNDRLRIAYFSFSQKSIQLAHERILDGGQWSSQYNLFKVNEGGLLAWCSVSAQSLNINLYNSEDGFKVIESVENIFKTDLNILAIANSHSNYLHLAVEGSGTSQELPIMVIQTLNNFGQVKEVRFARQETGKKEINELVYALNVGDFIVLKVGNSQVNYEVHIYSLQNESLVGQFKSNYPELQQITNNIPQKNQFFSYWFNADQSELNAIMSTWKRINSLSILKLLQAIKQIEQSSKDYQDVILLFGAHLSGKSTFRHYLCGQELEYFKHEAGFYQVKLKNQPQDPYIEQLEKNLAVSISIAEHAVIIEIPEWSHESTIFESQIFILMQVIFKSFKKLYTVVTISEEYIEDSPKNQQVFLSVLKMIKQQEGDISHTISIILTKIEDEDYLEMFKERIEEIMEINEQIGTIIQSINEAEKILIFKNDEHAVEDGQAMLEQILGYEYLPLDPTMCQKVTKRMEAEGILDTLQLIKHETNFYYALANQILTYFSYLTVGYPKEFRTQLFAKEVSHIDKEAGKTIMSQPGLEQSSQLIVPLFNALGNCKLFVQKKEHRNTQKIDEISASLMNLAVRFQNITTKQQGNFARIAFQSFITVLKISAECLKAKEDEDPYQSAVQILKSNSSILGKRFIAVVSQLAEQSKEVKSSALMTAINPFMKQAAGPVIVVTKTVPMTYNQQKSHYLKHSGGKLLETICALPSNVMKLDLMIEQLITIGKAGVTDDNLREVRYYLRECSRVCQFHQCFLEAIIFLQVIPDFAGISLLLDDLIDHCRATRSYESKTQLDKHESELIDELITICRTCVRESLLQKLIYLKTLNQQSSRKAGDLKNVESKLLNKQISKDAYTKYLQMLETGADLPFYNLKNDSYRKVIDSRAKLIERCRQFQESEKHKASYERVEAINWLVQTLPTP